MTESKRRGSRDMSAEEIEAFLARNFWGVLSTAAGDEPYAVPIIFGRQGSRFYSVVGPGRKVENIEANPRVCLTVVEVEDMARRWRSVVVLGNAGWVDDEAGVGAALDVIRAQYPGAPTRSSSGAAGLAAMGFRVLVVEGAEITGRIQE